MTERIARINIATQTATYSIAGRLKSTQKIDFSKAELVVHAFIGRVEVAKAAVNQEGVYKLNFRYREPTPVVLKVLPEKLSTRAANTPSLKKTMSPARYKLRNEGIPQYTAIYDIVIPNEYITIIQKVTKTYHMHGAVFATKFINVGGTPTPIDIEPLPAAKIEFYEVDAPILWIIGTEPKLTEAYLGYCYTGPDGSYEFEFDFSYRKSAYILSWLFEDTVPDIKARISQFKDGSWIQVYEGPVDWEIVEDYERDFFVPVEDTIPVPDSGVKPDEGFRFTSVGLLPIDTTRIVKGYATSQSGDPVSGISHQPFCGTLRIFGLFAESPPVAHYRIEIAEADENGPTGTFRNITDALHNSKWNTTENKWDNVVLGPDPVTGLYKNIDTDAEADWHEHALKATWNTANEPDGYYALRITGYDAAGAKIEGTEKTMPVMRIDNTLPEAEIEPLSTSGGGVSQCGGLNLGSDRKVTFRVKAHDPEGHVLRYWISGTRGKNADSAGTTVEVLRPDPNANWVGTGASTGGTTEEIEFTVSARTLGLITCSALAYNFELHVYSSATDCYSVTPTSQRIKKETNLIISE